MGHFWQYVDLGFINLETSILGNIYHEVDELIQGQAGVSMADLEIGIQGAFLGDALRQGYVQPNEVRDWLYDELAGP